MAPQTSERNQGPSRVGIDEEERSSDFLLPNVNFRPGRVSADLLARDLKPGAAAKQALFRYFDLLERVPRTLNFSAAEAAVVVYALRYVTYTPELMDSMHALIETRGNLGNIADVNHVDLDGLVSKVRALPPLQKIYLLDATERFWRSNYHQKAATFPDGLRAVGLTREEA